MKGKIMPKKQNDMKFSPAVAGDNRCSFYSSSLGEWRVDEDLDALIAHMKRSGLPFTLFYLPVPTDATYEIKGFAPQVEGAVLLGYWR